MEVLGVDGCGSGWLGVVVGERGVRSCRFAEDIASLVAAVGPVAACGIDIPIALAERGWRQADLAARTTLGRRASTLYVIPPRPVLEAPDHVAASARCRDLCGQGVSRQAYGLRSKIFEVRAWVKAAGVAVFEVHPELSFVTMGEETGLGRPSASKKRWAGLWQRLALLAAVGLPVDGRLVDTAGRAAPDDVLDAAAVAWSARRVLSGEARRYPPAPDGRAASPEPADVPVPMAVWA